MRDIAIYGAGGLGREIACLIRMINKKEPMWNLIGFFDDGKVFGESNVYGPILGGIEELNSWDKSLSIAFAIGSPDIVSRLTSTITNPFLDYPNLVSPHTIFLDDNSVILGKGNVICSCCIISCNVVIGDFNLFISSVSIGHDVVIGHSNVFMPCTKISGQVSIGNQNLFGVASTILQQIKIGSHTTIGANSLIIHRTKDGKIYMGSPATVFNY